MDFPLILRELNIFSVALRLGLAMLLGGLIGLERARKGRPAGFRTYMLVCLGAALTMLLGQYVVIMQQEVWTASQPVSDVARFGAQVVSGIGFLGAGTIIVTGRQEVKGLTTAAGLWTSACMGLAVGAGFYECVLLAFVLIFLSIWLLPRIEGHVIKSSRIMNVYVELRSMDDLGDVIAGLKGLGVHIYAAELDRNPAGGGNPSAVLSLRLGKKLAHSRVLSAISGVENVLVIEET